MANIPDDCEELLIMLFCLRAGFAHGKVDPREAGRKGGQTSS